MREIRARLRQVAIVNQSLASRFWPTEDPVGRRITFDNGKTWTTIVGLVANARQQIDAQPQDEIHLPSPRGQRIDRRFVDSPHARRAGNTEQRIARGHSPRRSATTHHPDRDARAGADARARFAHLDRNIAGSVRVCSRSSSPRRASVACWPFPSTSERRRSAFEWRSARAAAVS